ncbi:ParB/RepB/Spo0J family partition protein [Nocardia abscessus]|uniref:ParB/RepB/Spo0J family partition protein n=1 Tax=Nocardia abscessus TaxID=120957 RepID=UPI002454704B|nr:ParB/RepB/Spo0J family partition protein [Nocardia abscessus]
MTTHPLIDDHRPDLRHEFDNATAGEAEVSLSSDTACLDIDDLVLTDSVRAGGLDIDHVRRLAEVIEQLPPVSVHYGTTRVIDGMHRVAAARLNGLHTIRVQFLFGDLDDAFLWAVRANATHGLPLSSTDRRAAATRIIRTHPELSDRRIAGLAGLAPATIGSLRSGMRDHGHAALREGRDGRVRPLNAVDGRLAASRIIAVRPEASLREIAREAGISLGTARDVRLRVAAGVDPVPAKHRTHSHDVPDDPVSAPVDPIVDLREHLTALRRDPSLRYTESGRSFLHWLNSRMITVEEWQTAVPELPAHCGVRIAAIARECARVWSRLADEAETK